MFIDNLNQYQALAKRTANSSHSEKERKLLSALGLIGEAGEVIELIKKVEGHGHDLQIELLIEELGDVLWSIANISSLYGISLAEIANSNIQKLECRYPFGFEKNESSK